jgi:hypothetical protein
VRKPNREEIRDTCVGSLAFTVAWDERKDVNPPPVTFFKTYFPDGEFQCWRTEAEIRSFSNPKTKWGICHVQACVGSDLRLRK